MTRAAGKSEVGGGGCIGAPVLLALGEREQVVARGDAAAELDARAHVRIGLEGGVVHEVADEAVAFRADDAAGGGRVIAEAMG